jgi:haloalkane dehalogenase
MECFSMTPQPEWLDRAAYPFTSRFRELPAGRMHYVDEGRGEPILFVHGTPTWSFEYRHLIRGLLREYRCVAPDHLGFGLSQRPSTFGYRPEDHAEALQSFVNHLGLSDFTLVVHDFGGPIALPLALSGAARRLVILNSFMWPFDDDPEMARRARLAGGALGRFLYRHFNASLRLIMPSAYGDRRKLTTEIHRQYLSVFGDRDGRERVLWALARSLLGSSAYYASLWQRRAALERLPALIIWGLGDSAFRPQQLERWRSALPQAEVVELPAAGHWPHEEQPELVLRALGDFLRASPIARSA